jgi:hypothetical protein
MVLTVEGAETSGTLTALAVVVAGDETGTLTALAVVVAGDEMGTPPLGADAGMPPLTGLPSFVATSLLVLLFFSRLNRSFIDE